MDAALTRDDFAQHEGTKFKISLSPEETTEIELVEVSELKETDDLETFCLVFEAPIDAQVVSGMVQMEHESLGTLDLGVSPFAQDENCTKYEVVFNRSKAGEKQPR